MLKFDWELQLSSNKFSIHVNLSWALIVSIVVAAILIRALTRVV